MCCTRRPEIHHCRLTEITSRRLGEYDAERCLPRRQRRAVHSVSECGGPSGCVDDESATELITRLEFDRVTTACCANEISPTAPVGDAGTQHCTERSVVEHPIRPTKVVSSVAPCDDIEWPGAEHIVARK
jgi:hypothetical protein